MSYADERCTLCLHQRASAVLVDDHGHVMAAACQQHRGWLARGCGPGLFTMELVP